MSRVANILRFVPTAESRNDGELLAAFRLHRDETAFAELVRRHGPLVWGVCRRQLPDHADAEDAFQAAFLVLVRRAKSLSSRATVGPWLYKVAAWTARNLRRKNARRLARQSAITDPVPAPPIEPDSRLDIDAALLALPEKYRAPLILCHLEGLSRRDAAERLGCPEGTLSSLLSRGLARLRFHLTGYVPTVTVSLLLTTATVRAACASQLTVGASVHHLIEGVLHMFWVKKATAAMTALVVVFGMGLGVGVTSRTGTVSAAGDEKPAASPTTPPAPNTRLLDLAHHELFECQTTFNLLLTGCTSVKQQLDTAKPSDPALAELQKKVRELEAGVEAARLKLVAAQARVAELKGRQQLGGELAAIKAQLKELTAKRDEAAKGVKYTEERLILVKRGVEAGTTPRVDYIQDLVTLTRFNEDLARAQKAYDSVAAVLREYETRPTGPCIVVTAMPESPAGQWVVSEYGPKGQLIGSLTAEHETMLVRFLARTAKDSTAPKELRIVVWDGASAFGAFGAVNAAKEGGFKSVKFTGTIPTKGHIRGGAKDLPRHHLEHFETEKLFNRLLSIVMGC